jgi:hypothetical protein
MEEITEGRSRVWHSNRTEGGEPGEDQRSTGPAKANKTQPAYTSAYQRLMARRTR